MTSATKCYNCLELFALSWHTGISLSTFVFLNDKGHWIELEQLINFML